MRRRCGGSLAEMVLVMWLFSLVLAALARFVGTQGRLIATQHDQVRGSEAVRTAALILEGELRHLTSADVGVAAESLQVRAFRGGGVICKWDGSDILVRYRGMRLPNAAKDSVLLVTARDPGGAASFAVKAGAADTACGGALRVTLAATPEDPRGLALLYESGTYHLSTGALRYRVGRGGRQPLTEVLFRQAVFRTDDSRPGLWLGLVLRADSLPRLVRTHHALPLNALNAGSP